MITNSVKRSWLEASAGMEALYPVIHLVTDDYTQVEQVMEQAFFERNSWDISPDVYTRGQSSREFVHLSPQMTPEQLNAFTTGAVVTDEIRDDIQQIRDLAKRVRYLCEENLLNARVVEEGVKETERAIDSLIQKTEQLSKDTGAKRWIFYTRPDGEQEGAFAQATVLLMEQYVEMWKRALRCCGEDGRGLPNSYLVIYGTNIKIPESIAASVYRVEMKPLDQEDFAGILKEYGVEDPVAVNWYAQWMAGYTEEEVLKLLREITIADGPMAAQSYLASAKPAIEKKNRERILSQQLLTYVKTDDVSPARGVQNIVSWVEAHSDTIRNCGGLSPDEIIKGILMVGVPGTGKSLMAKNVASVLHLPCYQLKMSSILGKYMGESEKNFQKAVDLALAAAPAVLWIDEIEKALSGSDGKDGTGVIQRLFGQLLEFMQEMKRPVFVVATANSMNFPMEFSRNERFDARFCMGMPDYEGCIDIMKLKLNQFFGCGEDEVLARDLFDICCGIADGDGKRFMTGSDINTVVKELREKSKGFLPRGSIDAEKRKRLGTLLRQVLKTTTMTAEASRPGSLRTLGKVYCEILDISAVMAGSEKTEPLFTSRRFEADRILDFDVTAGEIPSCVDAPEDLDGRPLYDQWLFTEVSAGMNKHLVRKLRDEDPYLYQEYLACLKKQKPKK